MVKCMTTATVKARNNAQGGNASKHPKTGRYFGPGHYLGPGRYLGSMNEFFQGISTVCFTPKNTCTCMHTTQDVYGHVSIRSLPGRLHGRGRLHGSNVLTYCTWARTRRVSVISDGRYFGLLRYFSMSKFGQSGHVMWYQ